MEFFNEITMINLVIHVIIKIAYTNFMHISP